MAEFHELKDALYLDKDGDITVKYGVHGTHLFRKVGTSLGWRAVDAVSPKHTYRLPIEFLLNDTKGVNEK